MWVTLINIWTSEPLIPPEDQRNKWAGHKDHFLNLHNLKVEIANLSFPAVNLLLRQFIPKWKPILRWGHQVTAWYSRKNGSLIVRQLNLNQGEMRLAKTLVPVCETILSVYMLPCPMLKNNIAAYSVSACRRWQWTN